MPPDRNDCATPHVLPVSVANRKPNDADVRNEKLKTYKAETRTVDRSELNFSNPNQSAVWYLHTVANSVIKLVGIKYLKTPRFDQ